MICHLKQVSEPEIKSKWPVRQGALAPQKHGVVLALVHGHIVRFRISRIDLAWP